MPGRLSTHVTAFINRGLAVERAHPRGDDNVGSGATASMWCVMHSCFRLTSSDGRRNLLFVIFDKRRCATGFGSMFQSCIALLPTDTPGENEDDIAAGGRAFSGSFFIKN